MPLDDGDLLVVPASDLLIRANNIANVEALINIFVNSMEIFGIVVGPALLLGAFSALCLQRWASAGKLAIAGIILFISALAAPKITDQILVSLHSTNTEQLIPLTLLAIILLLLDLGLFIGITFLPTFIAFKKNKSNRITILVLNILLWFLPFGWNIVLFMSFMDDKEKVAA